MSDTKTMSADGGGTEKGAADGISASPDGGAPHGRTPGGESGGGGYDNPQTGKAGDESGFMGHGGQVEIAYHGSGQAGEDGAGAGNGVAGSGGDTAAPDAPAATIEPRHATAGRQQFDVIEEGGVAAAETTGRIGTDD